MILCIIVKCWTTRSSRSRSWHPDRLTAACFSQGSGNIVCRADGASARGRCSDPLWSMPIWAPKVSRASTWRCCWKPFRLCGIQCFETQGHSHTRARSCARCCPSQSQAFRLSSMHPLHWHMLVVLQVQHMKTSVQHHPGWSSASEPSAGTPAASSAKCQAFTSDSLGISTSKISTNDAIQE